MTIFLSLRLIFTFTLDVSNEEFNKQFWNRLQDEWKKISDGLDEQSPWLAEFSEYYDPYTVTKINLDIFFSFKIKSNLFCF